MLVLTRNEGQTILIGDDVRVTVVSTKGGQVRFGIQAPRDVTVLREELKDRDVGAGAGAKPAPDGGRG